MRQIRLRIGLIALLFLLSVSCATLGSLQKKVFVKPVISLKSIIVGKCDLKTIELKAVLNIYNPNTYPIPLHEVRYKFYLDRNSTNDPFFSGWMKKLTIFTPMTTNTVEVPLDFPFERLRNNPVTNGHIFYSVKGEVILQDFESVPIPFKYSDSFTIPVLPDFQIKSIQFTRFSPLELRTSVILILNAENTNNFDISLKNLKFRMDLDGKPVLSDMDEASIRIGKKSIEPIQLGFELDLLPLADIIASYLQSKKVSVHFLGGFAVETASGNMKIFNFDTKSDVLIEK